jgi:hypothetical protein
MAPVVLLHAAEERMVQWRRHLICAAQNAYVEAWQSAWTAGCAARWHGQPFRSRLYRKGPLRHAWIAGWNWANRQPDRRKNRRTNPSWTTHRSVERRALRRAATTGVLGLGLIAIVSWMLQKRADAVATTERIE